MTKEETEIIRKIQIIKDLDLEEYIKIKSMILRIEKE